MITNARLSKWLDDVQLAIDGAMEDREEIAKGDASAALFWWHSIATALDMSVETPWRQFQSDLDGSMKFRDRGLEGPNGPEGWSYSSYDEEDGVDPDDERVVAFRGRLEEFKRVAFSAREAAIELLMKECEKVGIDSTYIDISGRLCRHLFAGSKQFYELTKGHSLWAWPDCLGSILEMPSDMRAAIFHGEAAVKRLIAIWKNKGGDIKPETPTETRSGAVTFSGDFRSVNWCGKSFSFSRLQAMCVKVIWEARQRGIESLSYEEVLEKAGSSRSEPRLDHVFRNPKTSEYHEAWGTMIIVTSPGMCSLAET